MAERAQQRRWRPSLANEGVWVPVEGTLVRRHATYALEVDGWCHHLDRVEEDFIHLFGQRRRWLLSWTGKQGIKAALDGRTRQELDEDVTPHPNDRSVVAPAQRGSRR